MTRELVAAGSTAVTPKPRNLLVRALAQIGRSLGTRRHRASDRKRAKNLARLELDARVREVGEW